MENNNKWKILQTDDLEYVLLSNGDNIQKIKGKNSTLIIEVLNVLQSEKSLEKAKNLLQQNNSIETIDDVIEWLEFNKFINLNLFPKKRKINIIGEFSENEIFLSDFVKNLPKEILVNEIINISKASEIELGDDDKEIVNLIVAPLWHDLKKIKKISNLMISSTQDFLYIEIYNNGIILGPLMNISKGTACLNCIEKRKLLNSSNPTLLVQNVICKNSVEISQLSVFEIGNYDLNRVFIYNELLKVLFNNNKSLYNKSIFIDFNKYENSFFSVIKAPYCEVCNPKIIYNPLW